MASNEEPRYPSDLSDVEWEWIKVHIPGPGKLGRPARYAKREIINAIFYITRSGGGWRMMPKDFPHWRICYHYFARWQKDGVWERIHEVLRERVRLKHGKKKPLPLRLSTRRVLKQLITPECVATMLARRLWGENDIWLWIPLD
jgi:putative transposase